MVLHAARDPSVACPLVAPGWRGVELRWDQSARRVLEHRDGPLRVLGGPGTGKTTVLMESGLRRIKTGVNPERLLVLVGSRRAAGEFRERITGELTKVSSGFGTVREPLVRTVHSYAFGLLRLHAGRVGDPLPRLLAGPEQDSVVRELLLAGELAGDVPGSGWPERLRPALGVPGFAAELRELLLRSAERGLGPYELASLGARTDMPEWVAAGRFYLGYEQVNQLRGAMGSQSPRATAPALDAAALVAAALDVLTADQELLATERTRVRHLFVDDAQDLDPQQMELAALIGATSATFLLAGDPDQAVLGFRGADPSALRDADLDGTRTVLLTVDHRAAPALLSATARLAQRLPGSGATRRRGTRRSPPSSLHQAPPRPQQLPPCSSRLSQPLRPPPPPRRANVRRTCGRMVMMSSGTHPLTSLERSWCRYSRRRLKKPGGSPTGCGVRT